ncbi:MAG: DUF4384 domain-containing protein [Pseudomonadota bacterium]
MKNHNFFRTLLITWSSLLLIYNPIFFGQVALSQTKQTNNPQTLETEKSNSQSAETITLKQTEKGKAPDNNTQTQSSTKRTINNISPKKIKEMALQILSAIPKGKAIAIVDFTDPSNQVTKGSQAILLQVEPIVIGEGNRIGLSFIERKDLKLIMDEWNLNLALGTEGADPGAKALLGADFILTGKVLITGDDTLCTLKLVDLTTGKIITSVSGKANIVKEIKAPSVTAPTPAPSPIQISTDKPNSNSTVSDDSKLSVWTSKRAYAIGEKIEIYFSVKEPLYVQIIDITPDGEHNIIFPNDYQKDNFCLPGKTYKIPPENSGFELLVTPPTGVDRIKVIASPAVMDVAEAAKTRGIQFTKTLVNTTQTRANLSVIFQ